MEEIDILFTDDKLAGLLQSIRQPEEKISYEDSFDIHCILVKDVEKFRLGLDVINVYGEFLFSYRPEKGLNPVIFPQVLRLCVHNNHSYRLDNECKNRLDHLKKKHNEQIKLDDVSNLTVSSNYQLR